MDTVVILQFFRELVFMTASVTCAYLLVGGFIFMQERLKRSIIQSARN